jgi:site-specific recombinase XerD
VPHETDPGYSDTEGVVEAAAVAPAVDEIPEWFQQFMDHRQASKPSAHTMKAYRRDFVAIAILLTGGAPARLRPADITRDSMRTAFAAFAADHEAASIRRCWSTWNVLCTFLYTNELLAANPMQLVGRPKLKKPLPKALPRTAVEALLSAVTQESDARRTDWKERDLALVLTALLAGLRAEELRLVYVGDIRTLDDGSAVINVKGKGGKERNVPIRGGPAGGDRYLYEEPGWAVPSGQDALIFAERYAIVGMAGFRTAVRRSGR